MTSTQIDTSTNMHLKAIKVLQMISKCDERFENHLHNYRSALGTGKDYERAQCSHYAKERLISYYQHLIIQITGNTFKILMSNAGLPVD